MDCKVSGPGHWKWVLTDTKLRQMKTKELWLNRKGMFFIQFGMWVYPTEQKEKASTKGILPIENLWSDLIQKNPVIAIIQILTYYYGGDLDLSLRLAYFD